MSEYQILPRTWRHYTKVPHKPERTELAFFVAKAHAEWLTAQFAKRYNRYPSYAQFYAMWNLGWTKFSVKYKGDMERVPEVTRDAGLRYTSLVLTASKN